MQIIVRPSALRAATAAASDDPGRFALNSLRVSPDGTVSGTDGRILVTVSPDDEARTANAGNDPKAPPILAHPATCKTVADAASKGSRHRAPSVVIEQPDAPASPTGDAKDLPANIRGPVAVRSLPPTIAAESPDAGGAWPPTESVTPAYAPPGKGTAVLVLGFANLEALYLALKGAGYGSPGFDKDAVRLQISYREKPGTYAWDGTRGKKGDPIPDEPAGSVKTSVRCDFLTKDGAEAVAVLAVVAYSQSLTPIDRRRRKAEEEQEQAETLERQKAESAAESARQIADDERRRALSARRDAQPSMPAGG